MTIYWVLIVKLWDAGGMIRTSSLWWVLRKTP